LDSSPGTFLRIEVKNQNLESLKRYLELEPGLGKIYPPTNVQNEYVMLEARYSNYFGYNTKKRFKKVIKNHGGKLTLVTTLGDKPMLNSETKRILRDSMIVSAITFLTTLGGTKAFSSLDINTLPIAVISGLTAFLTRIALELKIK